MEKITEERKKVQIVAPSYYSRKDIQEALFKFCKDRETVPRYLEEFGKRPDIFDYPTDISDFVKKGATSFHCSEEIWIDPLKIDTSMTPEKYNQIRKGWDFLIDIDSKFFDYAKIAARVLIGVLESHGVQNIGIKYSGSKGFHILVPSEAFPEELYGQKTREMFPEWPRAIAGYLKEVTKDEINRQIILMSGKQKLKEQGELVEKIYCNECGVEIVHREEDLFECSNKSCKDRYYFKKSKKRSKRCLSCKSDMNYIKTVRRFFCEKCQKYKPNPKIQTKIEQTTKAQEDSVDIVLVSPRHLFRAPYSLHEKTSLVSVVLTREEFEKFEIAMANPLRVEVKNYLPKVKPGEAKDLLIESIDWAKKKTPERKKYDGKQLDLKGLTITEDMFPPAIEKILLGMSDGKKRALGILLSFFSSLEFPKEYIEEKIFEWNKKNQYPLKEGYVRSQIEWYSRNKRLPPNYENPLYRELGLPTETDGLKNPINYTIREAIRSNYQKNK